MKPTAQQLLARLSTTPAPPPLTDIPPEAPPPARSSRDSAQFLEEIEDMRASGTFDWCDNILRGIYDNVKERNWVTEGQANAIKNIKDGTRRGSPECYDGGRNTHGRRRTAGVYRNYRENR